jgi:Flp pilus assembly pilin Flp
MILSLSFRVIANERLLWSRSDGLSPPGDKRNAPPRGDARRRGQSADRDHPSGGHVDIDFCRACEESCEGLPADRRRVVNDVLKTLTDLRQRQKGQTMAEYGLVLAVVTIGTVAAFAAVSSALTEAVNEVIAGLPS